MQIEDLLLLISAANKNRLSGNRNGTRCALISRNILAVQMKSCGRLEDVPRPVPVPRFRARQPMEKVGKATSSAEAGPALRSYSHLNFSFEEFFIFKYIAVCAELYECFYCDGDSLYELLASFLKVFYKNISFKTVLHGSDLIFSSFQKYLCKFSKQ